MFDATVVERTFTRTQWRKLYRIMRKVGDRGDITPGGELADRAKIAGTIAKYIDDAGMVGVVKSGRDCDGVEYCYGSAERTTVMSFVHERDDMYAWADGPCYLSICSVDDLPESYSRDLVMEAHENGHPHSICSAY